MFQRIWNACLLQRIPCGPRQILLTNLFRSSNEQQRLTRLKAYHNVYSRSIATKPNDIYSLGYSSAATREPKKLISYGPCSLSGKQKSTFITSFKCGPYGSKSCYELNCFQTSLGQIRHYAKKGKKDKGGQKKKGHKIDLSDEELSQVINHNKFHMQMQTVFEDLQEQYISQLRLRTSAGAFDQLEVETEDGKFPLIQIAQITQKNPSLVMINMTIMPQYLTAVKDAISNSGMNVSPQQDGTTLFVPVPKVSREHREGLVKSAKSLCDRSKEKMRDIQNKYVKDCKQKEKAGVSSDLAHNVLEYVRNVHGEFVQKAEQLMKAKQQELLGK